ncbi:transposase [Niabella agricola]|uniref:transposase n=1 Tax=Niabella agricola TaxID=2891571 RepID=UPI001F39FCC6|nr:transposase [Niabella agricola]
MLRTVAKSIETHHTSTLNYFDNRGNNAAAESFNTKIKAFKAAARGVRDIAFFLVQTR